jgi:cation transport protein ChaC
MHQSQDLWVFAYGSLMWNPGFEHVERQPALLRGYHRAFCIYSISYRGTPDCPGLVLGLDRGGACRGIAYRVPETFRVATMTYLDAREMTYFVYVPKTLPVTLDDGRRIFAHTYVADPNHERYAGKLRLDELVPFVLQGYGERGACADYLENTVLHLDELGIRDGLLHDLLERVQERRGTLSESRF